MAVFPTCALGLRGRAMLRQRAIDTRFWQKRCRRACQREVDTKLHVFDNVAIGQFDRLG